jgi:hypothetical protein
MSLRRRLTELEHHVGAAGSRTGPDRLSCEEVAVVTGLVKGSAATPEAALSPLALKVLDKARHFAAFLNEMATRQRSST